MKKLIILSLCSLLTLTGCGAVATDTMTCTYKNTSNNVTTNMKYSIDYEDKEVKKVRITYDYMQDNDNANSTLTNDSVTNKDGVGTGTDGTTNDTQPDNDGIIDGIVGSAIDKVIGGVSDVILDVAGLKDRHATVQSTYGNIPGFSVQNTTDTDNNYKVTYVIDYDTISDSDLGNLSLSRDIDTLRDTFTSQGFSCDK